jgi:hypothetical protein
MKAPWVIILLLIAATAGCRTVWIHPEATQALFDAERAECLRAVETARAAGVRAPNWKRCMLDKGWTATTDFRSARAVREPLETTGRRAGPRARQ